MRAIDFLAKGNVVRVFLSNAENLNDVHGDDWNNRGCTDLVYGEYVDGYKDFVFDFHKNVYTCEGYIDEGAAYKNDMKAGYFPMIVVLDHAVDSWLGYKDIMAHRDGFKIYFGDEFEPEVVAPKFEDSWAKACWMEQ